jgi:hypothetical protein
MPLHKIRGKKFWVSTATPCKAGATGLWQPGAATDGAVFTGGGAYFLNYISPAEILTSIVVKRNGNVVTLSNVGGTGLPAPDQILSKDEYFATESYNAAGQRGIWFKFSPKNSTGADIDRLLWIYVVTNTHSYVIILNLETDATWGWNTMTRLTYTAPAGRTVSAIYSVTVTDSLGVAHPLTSSLLTPSTWATWDATKWHTVNQTGTTYTLSLSPEWAGCRVDVVVVLSAFVGDDESYYTHNVAIHATSLPAGHHDWANRIDEIRVVDQAAGDIADFVNQYGTSILAGMTFTDWSNGVARGGTVSRAIPDAEEADTALSGTDYLAMWASGKIYLATAAIEPNQCAKLALEMADRRCWPLATEVNAPATVAARLLGGT